MAIDALAVVAQGAAISSEDVQIGPYAIIEDGVMIGPGVKVWPHAYIAKGTEIGEGTEVHMGAVIGHTPQDFGHEGGESFVKIGKRNIIREYTTIHRGTKNGSATIIGDDNFFMVSSHVGHNCEIGNKVIVSNGALLAGYIQVEDMAFISGNVVIHQFCRIGKLAMIGGFSGVNKDVPPFMLVRGPSMVRSVNLVGLRRAGFSNKLIGQVKEAFRTIYRSGFNTTQAIEKLRSGDQPPEVRHLVEFVERSRRGICDAKNIDDTFF
ncbi:MAG: acyl-ACP--UDP-N-acetylglucosamine O-acyltransferase [Candidatus Omnitrophota bacterium]